VGKSTGTRGADGNNRTHSHTRVDGMNVVECSGVSDLVHIGVTEALVGPAAVGLQNHLRCNRAMSRLNWATHERATVQLRNQATTQRRATTNLWATRAGLRSMQPQWRTAVTSEYPVVSTQSTMCEYSEYQL
jgi:hypothetical protein